MEPEEINRPETDDYIPVTDSAGKKKKFIIGVIILLPAILLIWFLVRPGVDDTQIRQSTDSQNNETQKPYELERTAPVKMPPDDQDGDGIKDEEEERLGTSLLEFDTDFDGLSDIEEIETWKTDPNNWDTDGDGFADGFEVINGYNPNGEGGLGE